MAADTTYQPKVQRRNGGDLLTIASGGALDVEAGGELRIAGTPITATAAEINAIAGAGLSGAELGVLNGVVAGTVVAGLAVVPTTGKVIDEIDITLLKVGGANKTVAVAAAVTTPVAGAAAGIKINGGEGAFDGSNPTSVAHGLTTCTGVIAVLKGSSAPGDNTSVVTALINGANVDFYAWKNTAGNDPTLVASTGTEGFYWLALGT